jgi:DNA-binding IscR family transcriptional regulator
LIELASRLGFVPMPERRALQERCDSVGRLLSGLHRALEGAIAPMDCFVEDHDGTRVLCSHGTDESHCATKLMWTRVQMGVIKSLQRTTLGELVEFAQSDRDLSFT